MILPTKHVPTRTALLGVGATVLAELERPRTVTALWERAREQPGVATFSRFVLALDLLYTVGALDFEDGLLRRTQP